MCYFHLNLFLCSLIEKYQVTAYVFVKVLSNSFLNTVFDSNLSSILLFTASAKDCPIFSVGAATIEKCYSASSTMVVSLLTNCLLFSRQKQLFVQRKKEGKSEKFVVDSLSISCLSLKVCFLACFYVT